MPSSRITPKSQLQKKMGAYTKKNFNTGDNTTGHMYGNPDGTLDLGRSMGPTGKEGPKKRYTPSQALKDSKSSNAGVRAMGSYARNYFKKNSK